MLFKAILAKASIFFKCEVIVHDRTRSFIRQHPTSFRKTHRVNYLYIEGYLLRGTGKLTCKHTITFARGTSSSIAKRCFLLSAWIFILPEQSVELRFLISGKIYFLIGERRSGHCIWEEIWRNEKKHLLERGLHPGKHNDTQVRLHCHSDGLLSGSKCHCTQKDQLNTNTNTLF